MPSDFGKLLRPGGGEEAGQLYNPYAGLENINPRHTRTFRLPAQTEFVFQARPAMLRCRAAAAAATPPPAFSLPERVCNALASPSQTPLPPRPAPPSLLHACVIALFISAKHPCADLWGSNEQLPMPQP